MGIQLSIDEFIEAFSAYSSSEKSEVLTALQQQVNGESSGQSINRPKHQELPPKKYPRDDSWKDLAGSWQGETYNELMAIIDDGTGPEREPPIF
ncbi:hypothetical protein [Neolewinella antarctica]|uniref:Uncharacterized protein n=1 Tax=Neolewinella antarctica TaxID=442734 RepID=A0ABX0XCX9_9BACT|nr:hypothetical protein [Neolewinella antarctica]NJC26688.1 hypothetical protein [Neolewinella antarctica]